MKTLQQYTQTTVALLLTCFASAYPAEAQNNSAPPPLAIRHDNSNRVAVTWSNLAPGFVLQTVDILPADRPWQGVSQAPQQVGGFMVVTQAQSIAGTSARFFRLVTKGAPAGLDYVLARQNADGSWGSAATRMRDTALVLETSKLFGRGDEAFVVGAWALASFSARNNDELSRQAIFLATAGQDISSPVADLLAAQNSQVLTASSSSYPGRGWGLVGGYGNSALDTALVLRALVADGKTGGLSIVKEALAASATSPAHSFVMSSEASNLVLNVRQLSVNARFKINYPGGSYSQVDLNPGSVPVTVNFPAGSGTLSLTVQNLTGSAGSYSAEASFVGPDGFDYAKVTTPLNYLGLAQNTNGGWGVAAGEESHLMVTAEVVRSLAGAGGGFVSPAVLSNAVAWLLSQQNADGGFSSEATNSNPYETSLAMLAIRAAAPGTSLSSAAAYLRNAQLPNGSWGNDVAQTALALQALRLPPVVGPIPGQNVISPTPFLAINLDNYVSDSDNSASQITWAVSGNTLLSVNLSNRIATITYPPGTNISETLTFTATDPDGYSSSASAVFAVTYQLVDHTIARGGSATGSRIFSAASTVLDQTAYYTTSQSGVPSGVTYATTGVSRISSTQMQVNYQISAGSGTATGIQQFQVTYGLLDSGQNPLGPLTNNIFNFSILITP